MAEMATETTTGGGGVAAPAKAAPNRNAKGQFGAGNNANPGGRPLGLMQYARAQTQDGRELVDFAVRVLRGEPMPVVIRKVLPTGEVVEEKHDMTPKLEHRLTALDWLADRAFGKPVQKMEGEVRAAQVLADPGHGGLRRAQDR
mgnify:CR=1 FL=1